MAALPPESDWTGYDGRPFMETIRAEVVSDICAPSFCGGLALSPLYIYILFRRRKGRLSHYEPCCDELATDEHELFIVRLRGRDEIVKSVTTWPEAYRGTLGRVCVFHDAPTSQVVVYQRRRLYYRERAAARRRNEI